jgi:hypothetical protein
MAECNKVYGDPEDAVTRAEAIIKIDQDTEICDDPEDTLTVTEADLCTVEVLQNITPPQEVDSG